MRLPGGFLSAAALLASLIVAVSAAVAVGMLAERKKRPKEEEEDEEEKLPPVPVTVVSGFLGTGKTTLLNNVLSKAEGLQIGVIVNDLAEVNVDARLVRQVDHTGVAVESFTELQNGCLCCLAGDDLLAAVERTMAGRRLDHILVECSGMAQPYNIEDIFKRAAEARHPVMKKVALESMISVVDTNRILSWLESDGGKGKGTSLKTHHQQHALVELFLHQIECADVVVVNKADRVLASEVTRCRAAIAALNPTATILSARYGVVPLTSIIGSGRRRSETLTPVDTDRSTRQRTHTAPKSPGDAPELLTAAHTHESHSHESGPDADPSVNGAHVAGGRMTVASGQPGGVWSFVYVARRPFHPERLWGLLRAFRAALSDGLVVNPGDAGGGGQSSGVPGTSGRGAEADASGVLRGRAMWGVLRSKGLVWIATSMEKAREWSQAAGVLEIQHGPSWWSSVPVEKWPERREIRAAIVRECKGGKFGDRRQEIVFIGTPAMQEGLIRMSLDRCLLTDKEMGGGPSKWEQLQDPIALSLGTAVRANAEEGSMSHGRACPCCDPELRDMDKFAFGVGL